MPAPPAGGPAAGFRLTPRRDAPPPTRWDGILGLPTRVRTSRQGARRYTGETSGSWGRHAPGLLSRSTHLSGGVAGSARPHTPSAGGLDCSATLRKPWHSSPTRTSSSSTSGSATCPASCSTSTCPPRPSTSTSSPTARCSTAPRSVVSRPSTSRT
ncbi:hypothetical protein BN12_2690003 [Nostocoides japonicum T1-X7]|uniref:Uncharacterized protein n=1 Tax=Nostocoides japonicum T1-X7 TaxID=1194083 RepID=A0A077LWF2_9MICO|nr:hypothetical protein BN12_2690003 [Tetrasphaera japonica T1-X7]